MTNEEKTLLTRIVRHEIRKGKDIKETIKALRSYKFNTTTVRKYYKALKEG